MVGEYLSIIVKEKSYMLKLEILLQFLSNVFPITRMNVVCIRDKMTSDSKKAYGN